LAQQLTCEGHDVKVITFRLQYPAMIFPGRTQYTESPPPEGVMITRRLNSINPLNWIATGLSVKREKPEMMIIRYWLPFMAPCLGTVARIVRRNRHTHVISVFDNVIPHEKRPGDRMLTGYFTSSVDAAVVMSRKVMDDLASFRKDIPVMLTPHPLFDNYGERKEREQALEALGLDAGRRYLLFFGFVRRYKGLDLLIKALSDKALRDKEINLIIAGEFYEDDTPYLDMIKEYGLGEKVKLFSRFIKDDEVSLFFSVADLVVQPYRDATQSGVTQIAFHFDKPVLVTDVGGLKEIVTHGKCGYVVKADPGEIAASITDFFDNQRENGFAEAIKKDKERFSWERMTLSLMEVYKQLTVNS
jgi:glycosyltransferase involved in cell wall biosynthesis